MVIYVETVAKKIARNIHICSCKNTMFVCVGMNYKDTDRDKEHCSSTLCVPAYSFGNTTKLL